jgi:DNA invertase Pin-like site-specific DNA recombinase
MNLDGYVRVSRVAGRSGESFISPAVQRERIEGVAAAGGHKIIQWHEDLDQSGAKEDRPGFQLALKRIEAGLSDGIVVAKLDRFSRSVRDAAIALQRIEESGGAFISAEDSLDTSTPMGRFALHMMLAIAELEWERRRETWQTARERAVQRGVHVASRTPTGYDRDESGRLVPSKHADKIAACFEARGRGASWRELSLLMADVPSPYGSTEWPDRSLSHLLSNRVYLGEARSGEFVNPTAHEPLVTEDVFAQAQSTAQRPSPQHGLSILTGLLRCAGCRYCMKPDKMKPKSEEERVRMYRCRGRRAAGKCEAPSSVLARVVEPFIIDQTLERLKDVRVGHSGDDEKVDEARRERDEAVALRDNFLALDVRDPVLAQRELDVRQARVDEVEARLAALRTTESFEPARIVPVFPSLEPDEQRRILGSVIDAIFLRRAPGRGTWPVEDRVFICWRGDGPADLPGPGRRNIPLASFDW